MIHSAEALEVKGRHGKANAANTRAYCTTSPGFRWFTSDELYGMAKTVVKPAAVPLPGGMPYTGTVSAKILVNTAGEVVCIWRVAGHPVMIPVAVRAIHGWKLTPMIVNGKPVEFVGTLKVPVYSPPHS